MSAVFWDLFATQLFPAAWAFQVAWDEAYRSGLAPSRHAEVYVDAVVEWYRASCPGWDVRDANALRLWIVEFVRQKGG